MIMILNDNDIYNLYNDDNGFDHDNLWDDDNREYIGGSTTPE